MAARARAASVDQRIHKTQNGAGHVVDAFVHSTKWENGHRFTADAPPAPPIPRANCAGNLLSVSFTCKQSLGHVLRGRANGTERASSMVALNAACRRSGDALDISRLKEFTSSPRSQHSADLSPCVSWVIRRPAAHLQPRKAPGPAPCGAPRVAGRDFMFLGPCARLTCLVSEISHM